jgi:hypothetical protein
MAFPLAYTEQSLAVYLKDILGPFARDLEWDVTEETAGDFQLVIDETLEWAGRTTIAEETDLLKLRAIARWRLWSVVYDALAGEHDLSTDGQSLQLSQVPANVANRLERAYQVALPYLPAQAATAIPITYRDAYGTPDDISEWG